MTLTGPNRLGGGRRKAFASKGDDTTLTRFVKVPSSAEHRKRRQCAPSGLSHPAIEAGRSIFHRNGITPPRPGLLVSGHSNMKIGRDVRKGRLRGYWIYTLSLEERATCPAACTHWQDCYGNNMPLSKRTDHRDYGALVEAIRLDVERLLAVRGRRGILVRLHALGDFFSPEYVAFWAGLLARHPALSVFGYTARAADDPIGRMIDVTRARMGRRFAIRRSDGGEAANCTVSIRSPEEAGDAIVCPEQTGQTRCCATCALCWSTERNIAFLDH